MSFSGLSLNWPVACAPTPMMATSRMTASACGRHILVSEDAAVLRRVRERLDHEPHFHAVGQYAFRDRALCADQREDARALLEIDESLKERRLESLRREARDGVTVEATGSTDFDVAHCAVAPAGRTYRHSRKHDCATAAAFPAQQRR